MSHGLVVDILPTSHCDSDEQCALREIELVDMSLGGRRSWLSSSCHQDMRLLVEVEWLLDETLVVVQVVNGPMDLMGSVHCIWTI